MVAKKHPHEANFFQRILQILLDPVYFFSKHEPEIGLKRAFSSYAFLLLFSVILGSVTNYYFLDYYYKILLSFFDVQNFSLPKYNLLGILLTSLLSYPIMLAFSFLTALILHSYCKLFGSRAPYSKSYQLFAYSQVPKLVLGWIPFIGILVSLYTIVLLIIGTEHIHKFSRKKSVLIYIIPLGIALVIGLIIFTLAIKALTQSFPAEFGANIINKY